MSEERQFPIIRTWHSEGAPQPESIPWSLLAPHEAQAIKNHGQNLEQLAARGGLDPCEAVAVLRDLSFEACWPMGRTNGREETRHAISRLQELTNPQSNEAKLVRMAKGEIVTGTLEEIKALHQWNGYDRILATKKK